MPPIVPPERPEEPDEDADEEEEDDEDEEDPSFSSFPLLELEFKVDFVPAAVSVDIEFEEPSFLPGAAVAPAGVI